jgi:tellurite resistance protein
LVEEATQTIDSFSRFLGRNPDKTNSLQAYLTLPRTLWPENIQERFREFRASYVEPMEPLTCADLFTQFGRPEPPTPQMVLDLANGLQRVAVGMEPDVLAGARRPGPGDSVVLFPLLGEKEFGPRTARFQTASVTISLSSCLALSDGAASASELGATEERIATWTHLSADQQMRLRAQYRLGLRRPQSVAASKPQLSAMSQQQRLEVVLTLIHLAKTDGVISPKKVKFFEQLYRLLELDPPLVYRHLYSTSRGVIHVGVPSPSVGEETAGSQNIALDHDRISELKRETELVSALLGDVFDDEESDIAPITQDLVNLVAPPSECAALPLLPGLNSAHNAFLTLLLTRTEWSRTDLESAAREKQIMLDGAMESINEAALDTFGTMLFDGYDPIYIEGEFLENLAI